MATLYRGVPAGTFRFADALRGVATPRGMRLDRDALEKHVMAEDVAAGVTSWTTDRAVARRFSGGDGVILEIERSRLAGREVPRPPVRRYGDENEVLIQGRVEGATPAKP